MPPPVPKLTLMAETSDRRSASNVLVIDDHQIVLFGIATLLASCPGVGSVTKAVSAEEELALPQCPCFDIVIVDVELEGMSGFDLIPRLRKLNPGISVIFHSMHEEIWVIRRMMNSGADAIVLKGGSLDELKLAVECVSRGEKYFSSRYEEYCKGMDDSNLLTSREIEVLRFIGDGLKTSEIADRLYVSSNTVEFHRKQILRKLGTGNMAELIKKAIARGYLSFP